MKAQFTFRAAKFKKKAILISLISIFTFTACKKQEVTGNIFYESSKPPVPSPITTGPCENRLVINATLVPLGILSSARTYITAASADNKILFIGGWHAGQNWWNEPVPVDIYDISSNTWSFKALYPESPNFTHFRFGAGVASVGNKVLIGGGGDGFGDNQTSKVDIYNASTNTWTIQHLSSERQSLTAATVGNKVLFAGGYGYPDGSNWECFNTVDIYDNNSDTWSSAILSEARMDISAAASGQKIYFAGGRTTTFISKTIDIYDAVTNSWSVSQLQYPRTGMGSIAVDDNVYWACGAYSLTNSWWANSNNVEILNTSTGKSSLECMHARRNITVVKKDDNIVFFTGDRNDSSNGFDFEIYNTSTKSWSTGRLNQKLFNAAVISVNNTIYVAGGTDGNTYFNQVWKLTF